MLGRTVALDLDYGRPDGAFDSVEGVVTFVSEDEIVIEAHGGILGYSWDEVVHVDLRPIRDGG